MAKKPNTNETATNKPDGVVMAPAQAREPVTQIAIPTRTSKMDKATAKEMGLDASVYGDIAASGEGSKE